MGAPAIRRVSKSESKRLDSLLRPFEEGGQYLADHYDEIMEQHEDRWVALYGPEIVSSAIRRSNVYRTLRDKGIPAERAYVKFLTRKRRMLIL